MTSSRSGFTLVELLIVIAIIGVLATLSFMLLGNVRDKARDTKRKHDIAQIGRFLLLTNCYVPAAGFGEYDLTDVMTEIKVAYPQAQTLPVIFDPKTGSATVSHYRYQVITADKCIIFANLENSNEPPTLSGFPSPEAGRGSGVLVGSSVGVNGTKVYYQFGK